MKVITGRVVEGKIELETELTEGTSVAVLAAEDSVFQLSNDDEEELVAALAEIREGRYEDGWELLRGLRGSSRR